MPQVRIPRDARAWIEVDHAALAHNVREIRRILSPRTAMMAILKADAYGHGAASVAPTLSWNGASAYGVATIEEGIELRQAGIPHPILVLGYVRGRDSVHALAHWKLIPTICSPDHAREIASDVDDLAGRGCISPGSRPLDVHAKLDTGMSRLGLHHSEAGRFARTLRSLEAIHVSGIYSHLAEADSPDPRTMKEQQARFEKAAAEMQCAGLVPSFLHLANSAATLADRSFHYDLARVGIGLFGIYPAPHLRRAVDLQPALSIRSRLTQVKDIPPGAGVSYGGAFTASRPVRTAVVSIGYADGVSWSLSGRLEVLVRGRRIRQLGRITMDQLIVDVGPVPDARPGDTVTLLGSDRGQSITVEDWASILKTIPWEILCLFKSRLPRLEVGALEASDPPAPSPLRRRAVQPVPLESRRAIWRNVPRSGIVGSGKK